MSDDIKALLGQGMARSAGNALSGRQAALQAAEQAAVGGSPPAAQQPAKQGIFFAQKQRSPEQRLRQQKQLAAMLRRHEAPLPPQELPPSAPTGASSPM